MKIIQIFPGKIWGGAEQYVLDLGEALKERGHEVVYVTRRSKAVTDRLSGSVDFITMPFTGAYNPAASWWMVRLLKTVCPDVIHIHDASFVPVTVRTKRLCRSDVRIVLTRHIARASRVNPLFRTYFRRLHRMVFVSELSRSLWTGVNRWMPESRCMAVLNSIPDGILPDDTSLRERFCIAPDVPVIMFTGRVRRSKGCEVIVRALAEIKDLPFVMVFVGTCKPAGYAAVLARMAGKLGIGDRVFFYGFTDNVRSLVRQADIGVAPSIVREACHLSPMEFMQAGKCVIVSNNGAQPEYIRQRLTGLLIPPGDELWLADALKMLLCHPDMRARLGAAAKEYFDRNMSYDIFVDKILAAYN